MELKILELSASHAFGIEGIKKTKSIATVYKTFEELDCQRWYFYYIHFDII